MNTPRRPGEIRPHDRVVTRDRHREHGTVASIDGDTARVIFDGCGDQLWPVPIANLVRHWDVRRDWSDRGCRVYARHPVEGFLFRGTIRSVGVCGQAMVWSVQDYDYNELPDMVGDYITAERSLLEQTDALDHTTVLESAA